MEDTLNIGSAWEIAAEMVPDHPALAHGPEVRTWSDFEDRAGRIAAAMGAAGVGPGAKVAQVVFNGFEYLESTFAAFKVRAVPCNVNYRYREDELRYVIDNADAEVVFFDAEVIDRIDAVRGDLAKVKLFVLIGAGESVDWAELYEDLIAGNDPAPPIERSKDDQWFLYTGGTTGMPKAVMWPHGDLFGSMQAAYGAFKIPYPRSLAEVREAIVTVTGRGHEVRQLAAAPLMHGTSMLPALGNLSSGGMVATLTNRSFDADELWALVAEHRLTQLTVVGDAFCRPMVEALERGVDADLGSLRAILSSGVMWSAPVKAQLLEHLDHVLLVDMLGSSEGPGMARQLSSNKARRDTTAKFSVGENTRVLLDDGTEVTPGSGEVGKVALGFPLPLGYYKDPEKTEATFPTLGGRRWSIPGDFATVEADGTLTLLGRGSVCINTGGEKVFPEEVEETLKEHPAIIDANVVGLDDPKWGQSVNAVVSGAVTSEEAIAWAKEKLAGYKAPKRVVVVDAFQRKANGKPDYVWARSVLE